MSPRLRLFVALLSTGLVGYVALGALLGRVQGDTTYGQLTVFNEVVRLVLDSYVEPVDLERTMASAEAGLTEALDGDSAYLDGESFSAWQQPVAHQAEIGATLTRRFAFLMIVAARPGSPAERAGLRTGDVVKTIDGRHSRTIPAPIGERLLRGAPGSVVKLGIMRSRTEPLEIAVVREILQPAPPESRRLEQGPGYLRIREFAPQTADDVRARLDVLAREGVPSLVLDLRDVATGQAAEAIKVAELFVSSGVLGRLSGRKVPEQVFKADAARHAWNLPVVALVDNGTAGPGEILAAALVDAERARLVGQHTFGRAGVQKTVALPEGGLVLTVAKYLTPKGEPIHGKGLEPAELVNVPRPDDPTDDDVAAPAAPKTPAGDPILERAIELLKTPAEKKAA